MKNIELCVRSDVRSTEERIAHAFWLYSALKSFGMEWVIEM